MAAYTTLGSYCAAARLSCTAAWTSANTSAITRVAICVARFCRPRGASRRTRRADRRRADAQQLVPALIAEFLQRVAMRPFHQLAQIGGGHGLHVDHGHPAVPAH